MKRTIIIAGILPFALGAIASCDKVKNTSSAVPGTIQICFSEEVAALTRASLGSLDTNKFILSITDATGKSVYNGLYGNAPETVIADPGTYTITAQSCTFSEPLFEKPQFGDTQVAVVESGKACAVRLSCAQLNAGVKLNIKETFLVNYPNAILYLKSGTGSLAYALDEKRTAYFKPGMITLSMTNDSQTTTLLTRILEAQQMLTINVNAGYATSSTGTGTGSGTSDEQLPEGLSIEVDTSRNWISETIVVDENSGSGGYAGSDGSEISNAYSVGEAKSIAANGGEKNVWVYGYIVGGDCSSSSCSFSAPFTSATNLVIAAKTSCVDKSSCLSVELAKGDIRNALNLVDHPEYLGRQVFIKGNIVSAYYGIPGVKSLSAYSLK